jgi:hypothetical protein
MSTESAPSRIINIPLGRQPFDFIPEPDQPPAANSYFVSIQISPNLPPTVAHHPHLCQVDTGSCGIVIPESLLYVNGDVTGSLLPGVTKGGPATVVYEPSSNNLVGFYFTVAELGVGVDQDGECAFVAQNVQLIGASNAGASEGMMGVGFGRPTELGTNVFLNAPGVYPSFLMTTAGIWLGYTPDTLPNAASYGFQQLVATTPDQAGPTHWQTPAATISVTPSDGSGTPIAYQGNALLDTGLNLMMLGLDDPNWQENFVGQEVTIRWPGLNKTQILCYSFKIVSHDQEPLRPDSPNLSSVYIVDGPSPMNPKWLVPLGQKTPSFVNTGINIIRGAHFFFDGQLGQIAFSAQGS